MQKKRELQNAGRDASEVLLFHGTKACNTDNICRMNFSLARCRSPRRAIYLSRDPVKSLSYGDDLILCRVLPGLKLKSVDRGDYDRGDYDSLECERRNEFTIRSPDQILPYCVIKVSNVDQALMGADIHSSLEEQAFTEADFGSTLPRQQAVINGEVHETLQKDQDNAENSRRSDILCDKESTEGIIRCAFVLVAISLLWNAYIFPAMLIGVTICHVAITREAKGDLVHRIIGGIIIVSIVGFALLNGVAIASIF